MSSACDSSAQARGVENGTGSCGTSRISASGMNEMKLRISARMPFARAQSCHSSASTRRLQDGDAVDQRRTHGAHQRAVLLAVAGGDHPGSRRKRVLAEPALEQQRVEGLLHVRRAGRQFVQKQAERFRTSGRSRRGGQNTDARRRFSARRSRLPAHLGAEQRPARQAGFGRGLIHHFGFADAGRRQQQKLCSCAMH